MSNDEAEVAIGLPCSVLFEETKMNIVMRAGASSHGREAWRFAE